MTLSRTIAASTIITTKVMILIVAAIWKSNSYTAITKAFLQQKAKGIRTASIASSVRTNTRKSLSMLMTSSSVSLPSSSSCSTTSKSSNEVEQKFSLINHDDISKIQNRLIQLGFIENSHENILIDWYYDTIDYKLIQQDCWLRLRQKIKITSKLVSKTTTDTNQETDNDHQYYTNEIWQLKRGNNKNEKQSLTTGSTVYQEIEGPEAFSVAIEILLNSDSTTNAIKLSAPLSSQAVIDDRYDDDDDLQQYELPVITQSDNIQLVPFARIYATRSSWKYDTSSNMIFPDTLHENNNSTSSAVPYHDLVVDFDITDTGYAVGEVECIVEHVHQIEDTRHRIDTFLQLLLYDNKKMNNNTTHKSPILGKLEFYIQQKKPKLYQILIDYGIM